MADEMRDGIRKVLNKRASKRAGKNVFSYKVPYRDANGKQTSATFDAERAALAFRDRVRSQRNAGLLVDPKRGQISLAVYAAEWLESAVHKRERTYAAYEAHLRLHILPVLGGRQLLAVQRTDVQRLVNALSGTLAPRSVHLIYKTLASVMRCAALVDKRIPDSPCVSITLPPIPERSVHVLTADQVRALAASMPDRYRAAVLLAAGTGLRLSEVLGLTWDRVDLDARTVTVDRQLDRHGAFSPPKTRKSRRVVPMPGMVADALTAHRTAYPPAGRDMAHTDGSTVRAACLVFTTRTGRPLTAPSMRHMFRRARTAVGLPESVTFHVLRHTYASLLIAAGTHLTVLSRRMGHSTVSITSDVYGHLYPHEEDNTRTAIDAAFTPVTTSDDDTDPPAGSLIPA